MKYFDFILILSLLIYSLQKLKETEVCDFSATFAKDEIYTLNSCRQLSVKEGNQCCVGVFVFGGNSNYFCEEFSSDAQQDEIDERISEYTDTYKSMFPLLNVEGSASCERDVEPIFQNKCSISYSQTSKEIVSCSGYERTDNNKYCCLFKGQSIGDDNWFCNEFDNNDQETIENFIEEVTSSSTLSDITNINCIEPDKDGEEEEEKKEEEKGKEEEKEDEKKEEEKEGEEEQKREEEEERSKDGKQSYIKLHLIVELLLLIIFF